MGSACSQCGTTGEETAAKDPKAVAVKWHLPVAHPTRTDAAIEVNRVPTLDTETAQMLPVLDKRYVQKFVTFARRISRKPKSL